MLHLTYFFLLYDFVYNSRNKWLLYSPNVHSGRIFGLFLWFDLDLLFPFLVCIKWPFRITGHYTCMLDASLSYFNNISLFNLDPHFPFQGSAKYNWYMYQTCNFYERFELLPWLTSSASNISFLIANIGHITHGTRCEISRYYTWYIVINYFDL